MIETIKNIATVLGFILSSFAILNIVCPPIRKFLMNKVSKWSNKEYYDEEIGKQNGVIQKQNEAIQSIKTTVDKIENIVGELSDRILRNEADRLRSELFDCGNRCRRGIPLRGEEFRHIQEVYKKYSDELLCNGIGKDEYNYIKGYFNSTSNQNKLTIDNK